jgi:hypothetical protein
MEMLPWLINDSLLSDERTAVLDHAQSCVMCRREIKSLEELRDSVSRLSSPVPIPDPDMRNINARIDKLIDRQNWARRSISWIGEFFASPWRAAYVAQSVLLVVLVNPNTPCLRRRLILPMAIMFVSCLARTLRTPISKNYSMNWN